MAFYLYTTPPSAITEKWDKMILKKEAQKYLMHAEECLILCDFNKALDNLTLAIKIDAQCEKVEFIRKPLYNNLIDLSHSGQAYRDELIGRLLSREMWKMLPKELITDVGALKALVFRSLVEMGDSELQKVALLQALNPHTFLGSLFYIQRWWSKPSLESGYLAKIAHLLNQIFIEDAANSLPLNSELMRALKAVPNLVGNEKFPMLYTVVASQRERVAFLYETVCYGKLPFWTKTDQEPTCVYDGYLPPAPVEKQRSYSV